MGNIRRALPARLDVVAWTEDLARASDAGKIAAEAARARYERDGVPLKETRPTQEEGPDGTSLPSCVKVYLPPPDGRFGMIFEVVRSQNGLRLEFIAFGVRHHPRHSNAPTVYQTAHRRLHE